MRNASSNHTTPPHFPHHYKHSTFKVVVLAEVDRLSRQAQAALRRTMVGR